MGADKKGIWVLQYQWPEQIVQEMERMAKEEWLGKVVVERPAVAPGQPFEIILPPKPHEIIEEWRDASNQRDPDYVVGRVETLPGTDLYEFERTARANLAQDTSDAATSSSEDDQAE